MDQTIAGAFSGESAGKPRRRRVHYLRQKDRRVIECFSVDFVSVVRHSGDDIGRILLGKTIACFFNMYLLILTFRDW